MIFARRGSIWTGVAFLLVLPASLPAVSAVAAGQPSPPVVLNLIPWPAQVTPGTGSFVLTDRSQIVADTGLMSEAKRLAAALSLPCGTSGTGITFRTDDKLPAEGYGFTVTSNGVAIAAGSPAGAFYACQTLRQLIAGKTIPCVDIQDEPRLAWRGFMLDVSRYFFDKREVKTLLDQMAVLKLNTFHWHLTDDHGWRIEIRKYPKLTSVGAWRPITSQVKDSPHIVAGRYGGFYTQEGVREIVRYAAALHIRVVPEIDMPGHMSAVAASYPDLSPANGWKPLVARLESGSGERCAALCVGREKTVEFCQEVLAEVMELFPSKEIHIGGDEVFYDQWKPCPDMNAYKTKLGCKDWEEVQVAFGNTMSDFLQKHGRTAVFWNNIYRQSVDKRSVNQFWRKMAPARKFAEAGFDVLLSEKAHYYFDKRSSLQGVYENEPLVGLSPPARLHVRGLEGCMWTERVSTLAQVEGRIYPRIIAVAENAWTPPEKKNWDSFRKRVESFRVPPGKDDHQ